MICGLARARALIPTNGRKENKKRKDCQKSIQRGYYFVEKK
jgi:hypothetical protein